MTTPDARAELVRAARRATRARASRDKSMAELGEAVRAAVADGMTEVEAAYVAGVTRMTVRAWLGK